MSTYFTGLRRYAPRTKTAPRTGTTAARATAVAKPRGGAGSALTSTRNRRPRRAAAAAAAAAVAGAAAAAAAGAGTGDGSAISRIVRRRLAGGGPASGPSTFGNLQSTATSTLRRQQPQPQAATMPPARTHRRRREVEWIMKPSGSFLQCSESSSEDRIAEMSEKERISDSSSNSSSSSSSSDSESLQFLQMQRLEHLVPMISSCLRPPPEQVRPTKCQLSRTFCVPSQRIMTVEELKQAQVQQMQPRKNKPPPSRPFTQSSVHSKPTSWPSPNRKASTKKITKTVTQNKPNIVDKLPSSTGLKPMPSQTRVQPPNTKNIQCSIRKIDEVKPCCSSTAQKLSPKTTSSSYSSSSSSCSQSSVVHIGKKSRSPSPSSSSNQKPSSTSTTSSTETSQCSVVNVVVKSDNPKPSQKLSPKPTSTSNSSLSTSGTECSCERVVDDEPESDGYCVCTRAIHLTSTVVRIMPVTPSASRRASKGKLKQLSKSKIRSKTHSLCRGVSKHSSIKQAPLIKSISPPKSLPKVWVSQAISGQSVSHAVNQLTAQLKQATTNIKSMEAKKNPAPAAAPASGGATAPAVASAAASAAASVAASVAASAAASVAPSAAGPAASSAASPAPAPTSVSSRSLAGKSSIYLIMNQAKPGQRKTSTKTNDWVIQPMDQPMEQPKDQRELSGSERVNPYMVESKHLLGHNYDMYLNTPNDQGQLPRDQVRPPMNSLQSPPPNQGQLYERSRRIRSTLMSRPVSLNRIPRPRQVPALIAPSLQPQQKEEPEEEELINGPAGKIMRKAQHKVPRTMEDGIDMSYQYFVSIPLKRGRKPQVVRYLYRPMVRHLNGQRGSTARRSTKRGKRQRAAAGMEAQQELKNLDPDLAALGGAPLPLEEPPILEEKPEPEPKTKPKPTMIYDPAAGLNSPYKVPPLKLKSCYMSMLEKLGQMPYPEERPNPRRRRTRAAGGSELMPPPPQENKVPPQESKVPPQENKVPPLVLGNGGGGDDIVKDRQTDSQTAASVRFERPAPIIRRTSVVNYKAKATLLSTATGAPILYHQPLILGLRDDPMIRTITYETIEQEELEKEQLLETQLKKQQEDPMEPIVMPKSVSFSLEPVYASTESTSDNQSSSSSSRSSSSIVAAPRGSSPSKKKTKNRKAKASNAKGKGKKRSKSKGRR